MYCPFIFLLWRNTYSNPPLALKWVICFFTIGLQEFFVYSEYQDLGRCIICRYVNLFFRLSFHFLDAILWITKNFKFWSSPIYLFFLASGFGVIPKKPLSNPRSYRFMSIFLWEFLTLAFILGLWYISSSFLCVYGIRKGPHS